MKFVAWSFSSHLCYALRLADASTHAIFLDGLFNGEPLLERNDLLDHLGCILDQPILRNYLEMILDPANNLTEKERVQIVDRTAFSSVIGLDTSLDFLNDSKFEINSR